MLNSLDLVCLGNLCIDDIILPNGTYHQGCFGGDAVYAAIGASYWSDNVAIVAPTGNDLPIDSLRQLLTARIKKMTLPIRDIPSIHNIVRYKNNDTREWTLLNNPEDFLPLSPTINDIPREYLNSRAFLILAMDLIAQELLIKNINHGIKVLDFQEDYIIGNEEKLFYLLKEVDIIIPSIEEIKLLYGNENINLEKIIRDLSRKGPSIIVIKQGQNGSLIYDREINRFFQIPAYPTVVIDTTGAGDAYCGGFTASYLQTDDVLLAGLAGSISASFAIEDFGFEHMLKISNDLAHERLNKLKSKIVKY